MMDRHIAVLLLTEFEKREFGNPCEIEFLRIDKIFYPADCKPQLPERGKTDAFRRGNKKQHVTRLCRCRGDQIPFLLIGKEFFNGTFQPGVGKT